MKKFLFFYRFEDIVLFSLIFFNFIIFGKFCIVFMCKIFFLVSMLVIVGLNEFWVC